MITLMNIFAHPKDWAAAFAVVPVRIRRATMPSTGWIPLWLESRAGRSTNSSDATFNP